MDGGACRWRAGLGELVGLRTGPIAVPDAAAVALLGPATLELVFAAPRSPRRAVLLHRGAPFADADARGWALAWCDGRVELWRAGRLDRRSRRLAAGAHRVVMGFSADGEPLEGAVDGHPLRPAPASTRAGGAAHGARGELPVADGIVAGGLRDLAGGHTDLRFGERRGEWLERMAWWDGGGPGARRPGRPADPALSDAPPPVRLTLRRHGDAWRYAVDPPEAGARVVWDFEDELAVGAAVTRPAALVPSHPRVVLWPPGGAPRRLRAPRAPAAVRPTTVFAPGDGGYAAFRIPAVVRAADGALLAFAEGRRESVSDASPTKDLVLRRSEDGGRSWGPLVVAAVAPAPVGAPVPPGAHADGGGDRSLMNPSPVVDTVRGTGRVLLLASHLTTTEWAIAAGAARGRLLAFASDDHGRSWGEPVDVAAQLGLPEGVVDAWPGAGDWRVQVGTLGHGLQLRRGPHPGRLCFVGHGTFGPASVFDALGFLFWSDDLGASWRVGPAFTRREDGGSPRGWNEGTLAELADGTLLLNARQYRGGRPAGCRASLRIGWDAGRPRPGEIRDEPELIDSAVQASLLTPSDARPDRLLFCHPAHPSARLRLTLRASHDGDRSWPHARLLVAGRVGYSDLVALDDGAVGVLYEAGQAGTVRFLWVAGERVPGAD